MKKAVITILGTAGTQYDKQEKKYFPISMDKRASYTFLNDEIFKYHNTFPLLIEKYKDDYDVIALHTAEAKQAQESVLKLYKIDYNFNDNHFIKNPNDDSSFFSIINTAMENYDEIIFDVSHGFRHLPLLALIGLIVENIDNPKKIKNILFAQEEETFKRYKFVDLKHYLDISNIALILRSFLSTYKVPELEIDLPLYKILKDFSIHLTSNQFADIFDKDISLLKDELKASRQKLFFVKELLDELDDFIEKIEKVKAKSEYEKFLFFSKLFLGKGYLLHSSTYLIEGITYYMAEVFSQKGYINFDTTEYANQTKIVSILKLSYSLKDFNFPNEYFIDINIDIINQFNTLRENVASIRHNLAHVNISKTYENIEDDLKKYIHTYSDLIENKILYNLDSTLDKKKFTIKFLLEQYGLEIEKCANRKDGIPKTETILRKYGDEALSDLTAFDYGKIDNFCQKYCSDIKYLIDLKGYKNRTLLVSSEEIKKLKFYKEIKHYYESNQQLPQAAKEMPNGEVGEVENLKKKKSKIIQSDEDKKLLKDGAGKLAKIFANR
jgi:CRISPR-associated DxTHG motif protein